MQYPKNLVKKIGMLLLILFVLINSVESRAVVIWLGDRYIIERQLGEGGIGITNYEHQVASPCTITIK